MMELRMLADSDTAEAVSAVYEASWRAAYRGIVPQPFLDAVPEGQWCPSLRAEGRETLLLLDGGRIIGTASFGAARDSALPCRGELISLYLLPEYFGRGLGGRLLDAALDRLRAQGFTGVLLWVLAQNSRARRFYARHGFTPDGGARFMEIGGARLEELRYVRFLSEGK